MSSGLAAVPGIGAAVGGGFFEPINPGMASASSDPNDDPMARLFGALGVGGGGGPVVIDVNLGQLGRLLGGRVRMAGANAATEGQRPDNAGEPETLPFLREVPLVRSPVTGADPLEREVFAGILDLNVRRTADLHAIAAARAQYATQARFSTAADTARVQAWFLAREADYLMATGNPESAVGFLNDARVYVNLWRQARSDAALSHKLELLRDLWVRREEAWGKIAQDLRLARSQYARAQGLGEVDAEAGARLAVFAGRRLLDTAKQLDERGYPIFVHHVLHYYTEDALDMAAQLFDRLRDRDQAGKTRHLLEEAKALHEKAHDAMYRSGAWNPVQAEDGLAMLRPNSIKIRDTAVSLAAALGIPPLDSEAILESVRNGQRIGPIEGAVEALANLQGPLNEIRGVEVPATAALFSSLLFVSLGLETAWGQLTTELGRDIPPYVRALFGGFFAVLGRVHEDWGSRIGPRDDADRGLWRVARRHLESLTSGMGSDERRNPPTSGDVDDELQATRTLMEGGRLDVAHTLIERLERDLKGGPRRLRSQVKFLHQAVDRRMAEESGESLSARGLPPELVSLLTGGQVVHGGEVANESPGLLDSLLTLLGRNRRR